MNLSDITSHLAKKKILLIIVVFFLIALCIYFLFSSLGKGKSVSESTTVMQDAVKVNRGTSLLLKPENITAKPQEPFAIDVVVDNKDNPLTAVDLKLIFDSDMVIISKATLGNFFTSPVVLENNVDNKRGVVSVSLGSTTPATQSGTLLHLNGVVRGGVTGETDLIILPESKVGYTGSSRSILENTGQTTISVLVL